MCPKGTRTPSRGPQKASNQPRAPPGAIAVSTQENGPWTHLAPPYPCRNCAR